MEADQVDAELDSAGNESRRGTRHAASGSGPPRAHERDAGHGNVFRLLTGLPAAGVLDHRVGSLTPTAIQAILADPDTVFRRLVVDPDTGWLMDAGATTYHPGRNLAQRCARGIGTAASRVVRPRPGSATWTM